MPADRDEPNGQEVFRLKRESELSSAIDCRPKRSSNRLNLAFVDFDGH
jgi:hypothetical protein